MSTTPTNEPKMPEVIYAYISTARHRGEWFKDEPKDHHKSFYSSYHHDDKVQELRESLRECVDLFNFYRLHGSRMYINVKLETALTKASNLLK